MQPLRLGTSSRRPARAGARLRLQGLERRRRRRVLRADASSAPRLEARALRADRPGGVLRLPGHAPDDPARRGPQRARSPGRRSSSTRRACRAPRATSSCSRAPSRRCRWRTFCRTIVELAEALGVAARRARSARCWPTCRTRAPCRSPASPPTRRWSSASACARRATRARPGSSASCTTPCSDAGLPSARLWASVPALRRGGAEPEGRARARAQARGPRRRHRRRRRARVRRRRLRAPGRRSRSQSDPDVQAFVERLEQAAAEEEEPPDPDQLPSGDVIAREFQRFLRQRGPDG